MEDRVDDAEILIRNKLEEYGKGKSSDKCPAVGLMNRGTTERGSSNRKKGRFDTTQELHAKAQRLFFVPVVGVRDVRLGLWEKDGRFSHFDWRMDRLT